MITKTLLYTENGHSLYKVHFNKCVYYSLCNQFGCTRFDHYHYAIQVLIKYI